MSRHIPEDVISLIQSRNDIADIIAPYSELKKTGSRLKALCPFHNEKTPSFVVSPENQTYHCFGCGKKGNVFTFLMDKENLSFVEAVRSLADRSGIRIPESDDYKNDTDYRKEKDLKQKLLDMHRTAAKFYSETLFKPEGIKGLEYLRSRNIPDKIISDFSLGFAPDSWDSITKLLKSSSYSETELLESGLAIKSESAGRIYDRFRNRITFPIWDEHAQIVGFSSRTILKETKEGKYINSPETPIFKKSKILYGYHLAKTAVKEMGFAILCEGQIDVISMHRAGFPNSIAPQGTAFTQEQARMIKRLTDKTLVCFDSDGAGIKAAVKAIEILIPLNIEVKVISLPPGDDPDSLFTKSGKDEIEKFVNSPSDFIDFLIKSLSVNKDISSPLTKSSVASEILKILAKIQDPILRSSYTSILSQKMDISSSGAFETIQKFTHSANHNDSPKETSPHPLPQNISPHVNHFIQNAEKLLLILIIEKDGNEIARLIDEHLPPEMITSSSIGNALNTAVSMTVNGEWEAIPGRLNLLINENQANLVLAEILTHEDLPFKDNSQRVKACLDSINKIKTFYIKNEIDKLKADLKNQNDEDAQNTMRKIMKLQMKINKR